MPIIYPADIKQKTPDEQRRDYGFPVIQGLARPGIIYNDEKLSIDATTDVQPYAPGPLSVVSSRVTPGISRVSVGVLDRNGEIVVASQSFNNGKGTEGNPGKYLDEVDMDQAFCFAPGHDKPIVCWKLLGNRDLIKSVQFELFCRGRIKPIWSRVWKRDLAKRLSSNGGIAFSRKLKNGEEVDVIASGSRAWEELIAIDTNKHPSFPDGLITAEYSPYQLRMTLNPGSMDSLVYPSVAWTYIHVIVSSIKLSWGTDAVIPAQRTDVADLAWTLQKEKAILAQLQRSPLSLIDDGTNADSTLDILVPSVKDFKDSKARWGNSRGQWGHGPRIPILAKASVRTAAGDSVAAPKALGKVRLLWEWQDNDSSRTDDWLARWIGNSDDRFTHGVTNISRAYLKDIFRKFHKSRFPRHAYNCPAEFGGKRGKLAPSPSSQETVTENKQVFGSGPVFLESDGQAEFPYIVKALEHRDWAVVSEFNQLGESGVLFQPSVMAGDRYRLTCYLVQDKASLKRLDKAVDKNGKYYDLLKIVKAGNKRRLPFASTRYFEIYKHLNITYWYAPAFSASAAGTVAALKATFESQLGTKLSVTEAIFPNLRDRFISAFDKVVQEYNLQAYGPMLFYSCIDQNMAANLDYAFDVLSPVQAWANLESKFKSLPIVLIKVSSALPDMKYWLAQMGVGGGAKGFRLTKPQSYKTIDDEVVLVTDSMFSASGRIAILDAKTQTGQYFINDVIDAVTCWGLTVVPAVNDAKPAKTVVVEVVNNTAAGGANALTLTYVGAAINLSDAQKQDLKNFILQQANSNPTAIGCDKPLILSVISNNDVKEKQRAAAVVDHLNSSVIDREPFYREFLNAALNPSSATPLFDQFVKKIRDALGTNVLNICLRDHIESLPVADSENRLFFYHLRGATTFNTFDTGGVNVGAASKMNILGWCYESGNPIDKRLLKSGSAIIAHEVGHLYLDHAAPRHFDTKPAGGAFAEHLCNDTCIMNYDIDSIAFCGRCILKVRGWNAPFKAADDDEWKAVCEQMMQRDEAIAAALAATRPAYIFSLVASKLRRAMFKQSSQDISNAQQLVNDAAQILGAPAGSPQHIWLLRNLIVFSNSVGNVQEATRYANELTQYTQSNTDVGDVWDGTAVRIQGDLGNWKNKS